MKDLIRTNNPALISYVEALLKQLDIHYFIADQAISSAEGFGNASPRWIAGPASARGSSEITIPHG